MKNTEAYPLDRLVHPPMMMPALSQDNPPGSEAGIPMLFRPAVAKIVVAAFTLLLLGVGSVRAAFWLSDVAGQEPDLGIAEVKDDWSSVSSSELLARADRLGAIIAEDEEAYALAETLRDFTLAHQELAELTAEVARAGSGRAPRRDRQSERLFTG